MSETEVKERPILFSGPMVRAILLGKKTQTRRIIQPQPTLDGDLWWLGDKYFISDEAMRDHLFHEVYGTNGTPYGSLYESGGDRIWVRETWGLHNTLPIDGPVGAHVYFRATDGDRRELRYQLWRPSIFMPRWASRITLEITDIRVERLQEITEEDAIAEGFAAGDGRPVNGFDTESPFPAVASFRSLWEQLNAERGKCKTCKGHGVVPAWSGSVSGGSLAQDSKDCPDCKGNETGYGWDQNPWVWVIEFKRLEGQ